MNTHSSILFVGALSVSDMISDIICAVLYITSGDPFLMQLGWISTGFLSFSTLSGTILTATDGGSCM